MIEQLKLVLQRPDTVLFIGSGVSRWSLLPTWSGLILELAEFLKSRGQNPSLVLQELESGDLLQAASYGFDQLTKQQFAEFIRNSCRLGVAQPHEIHKKIINLGPSCYVTTNYDRLLEASFQRWIPTKYYRTVVNKQLTETAEIIGARSDHFLFKLHGDVENSDSIIVTREQYKALNPDGELHYALDAVKTLMVSRPFVYIGFGLRDPDFLYVKDLLFNTYKGGARDHYAIMADISDPEKDYWKRQFGIHLINYETKLSKAGEKEHSAILSLLDELCDRPNTKIAFDPVNAPEFVLSLARHASKYSRFENSSGYIPLIVHPENERKNGETYYSYQFYDEPVEKLLDNGPQKFILIGLPGSGKSYALKNSMARIADELRRDCIDEAFKETEIVIPIIADLKLYNGSVFDLLENALPTGMHLDLILSKFKVKIYLDAFNEMRREYIESNAWEIDFSIFLKKASNASIVIASRTTDGLGKLEMPIYALDAIKKEFIAKFLDGIGVDLKGRFKDDIFSILQRPFFYKLLTTSEFRIDSETSPRKIYQDLLKLINSKFVKKFSVELNLLSILSDVAMKAIDSGEEAFKTETLKTLINSTLQSRKSGLLPEDIINWLVGQDFLVPLPNERICFFHQSVTEFLAAKNLAGIYCNYPQVLKDKLAYRRWDQALFLTLSLLDEERGKQFLENMINIDFKLALSAVKFMEFDNADVVNRLLQEIPSRISADWHSIYELGHFLEYKLPLSRYNLVPLREIIKCGNATGGAAVSAILNILGEEFKKEAMELMLTYSQDYNFCSTVGRALQAFVSETDFTVIFKMTDQIQASYNKKEIKDLDSFTSALGYMLRDIDPIKLYHAFLDLEKSTQAQTVRINVVLDAIRDNKTNDAFKIALELLEMNIQDAIFTTYFITVIGK